MLLGVGQSSGVMGSCQEDVKLNPQEIISLCMAVQCHHLGMFRLGEGKAMWEPVL